MCNLDDTERPPSGLKKPHPARWIAVALVALVAIGAGVWLVVRNRASSVPALEPVAQAPAADAQPLGPKEQTDPLLKQVVSKLCAAPGLASFLATDDIARRLVTAVDNVARGDSVTAQLPTFAPEGAFKAVRRHHRWYVDARSYKRYDRIADTLAAMDMQSCAGAYAQLKPMLDRAYREVGQPGHGFDEALSRAIKRLTAIPVPTGEIELTQVVFYKYADPELEALPAADKHLLRMGPRNMRIVQTKLKELASALKLPEVSG